MLTPTEAFRAGFLLKCAEDGLSASALQARLALLGQHVKTAGTAETLANLGLSLPLLAVGGGAAIGAGLGGVTGSIAAAAQDPLQVGRPASLNRVQQAEMISVYRQQAEKLRRQKKQLDRQAAASAKPRKNIFGI